MGDSGLSGLAFVSGAMLQQALADLFCRKMGEGRSVGCVGVGIDKGRDQGRYTDDNTLPQYSLRGFGGSNEVQRVC